MTWSAARATGRHGLVTMFGAMICLHAAAASAEPAMVLLLDEADAELSPALRRLTAELSAVGFRVERSGASPDRDDVGQLLADTAAFAAIAWREGASGTSATLWYRGTAQEMKMVTFSSTGQTSAELADLALRTAEHLHGAQVEALAAPDRRPPPDPALPSHRWWLASTIGGGSSGAPQWSGVMTVLAGWSTPGGLNLSVDGLLSLTDVEIAAEDERATLRFGGLRAAVTYAPWANEAISPSIGGGVGWLGLLAEGQGASDKAVVDGVSTSLVFVRAGLDVALSRELGLVFAASVGQAMPEIPVRFEGESIATGAAFYTDVQIGLSWSWHGDGGAP